MTQLFYLNRIYPLSLTKIYNSPDSSNTNNYSKNIYNYSPISILSQNDNLMNTYQNPLYTLFNDSKVLSTCIQHTSYSNLIEGNLDKPCTGVYCKYRKIIHN